MERLEGHCGIAQCCGITQRVLGFIRFTPVFTMLWLLFETLDTMQVDLKLLEGMSPYRDGTPGRLNHIPNRAAG